MPLSSSTSLHLQQHHPLLLLVFIFLLPHSASIPSSSSWFNENSDSIISPTSRLSPTPTPHPWDKRPSTPPSPAPNPSSPPTFSSTNNTNSQPPFPPPASYRYPRLANGGRRIGKEEEPFKIGIDGMIITTSRLLRSPSSFFSSTNSGSPITGRSRMASSSSLSSITIADDATSSKERIYVPYWRRKKNSSIKGRIKGVGDGNNGEEEEEEEKDAEGERQQQEEVDREEGKEEEEREEECEWEDPDSLKVISRLGAGKFSEVFEAKQELSLLGGLSRGGGASISSSSLLTTTNTISSGSRRVALKVLRPVPPWRVDREVYILKRLQGGPNIVTLWGRTKTFRDALVLEFLSSGARPFDHGDGGEEEREENQEGLSDFEIRYFLYELLRALEWSHTKGIMHRDVKNRNVLIDQQTRQLRLIDWGSADVYLPEVSNNVYVASRYFKAPELLVGYPYYDYCIDLWGVGCMLAGLLFKREPFFRGLDDRDQLRRIGCVLGTEDLYQYCEKYHISLDKEFRSLIGQHSRKPWSNFITRSNQHLYSMDALDLLDKLLRYDHQERITATEALAHDYFEPIRHYQAAQEEARSHPFLAGSSRAAYPRRRVGEGGREY